MKKIRADILLVERGLTPTRQRAKIEIMAGRVFVGNQRVVKASECFSPDVEITLKGSEPYVSRGGHKLEFALKHFHIHPEGWRCLDIGAGTGGFTDCLLQHGSSHVTALDVGHSQLSWKLRKDPRVCVMEKTNARWISALDFDSPFDLVVMDVSFISQRLIHPVLNSLIRPGGKVITLIKPQFEALKHEVGKGGIVRDPTVWRRVCDEVSSSIQSFGFRVIGIVESPILGGDGNKEFLLAATFDSKPEIDENYPESVLKYG